MKQIIKKFRFAASVGEGKVTTVARETDTEQGHTYYIID